MVQAQPRPLLNQKEAPAAGLPMKQAQARLTGAFAQLKEALATLPSAQAGDAVLAENESLQAKLDVLQEQHDRLQDLAYAIYDRLDDSIAALTKMIEA